MGLPLPNRKFIAQCRARFYTAPKKIFSSAGYKTLPYKGNRLNVGRGFTTRRENLSAGCKTLPYKGNWLNVERGFTPRRENSSAGYKTLPYKGNWLNVGRGFTPRRKKIRRQGIKPCPTKEIGSV